jgi:hypothetical protein
LACNSFLFGRNLIYSLVSNILSILRVTTLI